MIIRIKLKQQKYSRIRGITNTFNNLEFLNLLIFQSKILTTDNQNRYTMIFSIVIF
jgi:hypothetical protein